jgi:hypothetical protein
MIDWPSVTPALQWPDLQWSWRHFISKHPTRMYKAFFSYSQYVLLYG